MCVCKLNSVLSLGSSKYTIKKISKNGVTLEDSKKSRVTYSLKDLEENLTLGVMKVEKC